MAEQSRVQDYQTKSRQARQPSSPVFFRLLGMLRPYWGMIALGMLMLLLSVPGELFPALVWKYVTDDLILRGHSRPTPILGTLFSFGGRLVSPVHLLFSSLIWLFFVYETGEILGTASTNVMNRVAQKFIFVFRNRVYHKLQSQSLGYLQRQRQGDLISRAMGDVDELQSFVVNGIDQIIGEGIVWVATVVLLMMMDWRVTTASLAPLLIVYVLLRYFNQRIKSIYTGARERLADVTTRLQENLSGVVVIKIFGREKQEAQRFYDATEGYYRQQVKAINARSFFFSPSRSVGFFSNILMLGMGAFLILTGGPKETFTVGKLLAFRAYWWRLYGPVQTLARVNDMVQRAAAAGRRVFEILDAPDEMPDAPDARPLPQARGEMELSHVSFRYPGEVGGPQSPIVLQDISLHIEPGQTVALCGPSGSGKSTILNLLLRFYDPASGQVTLDGQDLRSIQRDSFRRHFALVQQETFLFNDSILDNIRYGHPEATMEQVVAAAKAANVHGFISKLPSGYETKVGERGVRLSGGQKQRLSIARAFLANPTLLLLDEPTSSVEPDSEATIIAALDRLMAGRTTVLTSHRPSLINQADMVYVIQDGRVTEQGPPDELARASGWFARFMRSAEEAMPEMAE
ncbi:MAG: transporter ATP-binding protein [Phycisphaerales bacterium]|nr:transporter ATP-binding protein [Phycisphaerales bacterium]